MQMTKYIRYVILILLVALTISAGWAAVSLWIANSPFLRLGIAFTVIAVAFGYAYSALVRGISLFRQLGIILFALAVCGTTVLVQKPRSYAIDPLTAAFRMAEARCQLGNCHYDTSPFENVVFEARSIHSLALKMGGDCFNYSVAVNNVLPEDSIIADFEQYELAVSLSRTRYSLWIFEKMYPHVSLVSRGVVPCNIAGNPE